MNMVREAYGGCERVFLPRNSNDHLDCCSWQSTEGVAAAAAAVACNGRKLFTDFLCLLFFLLLICEGFL